jgi:hypothetical protein
MNFTITKKYDVTYFNGKITEMCEHVEDKSFNGSKAKVKEDLFNIGEQTIKKGCVVEILCKNNNGSFDIYHKKSDTKIYLVDPKSLKLLTSK